jgi:hypothetical protein
MWKVSSETSSTMRLDTVGFCPPTGNLKKEVKETSETQLFKALIRYPCRFSAQGDPCTSTIVYVLCSLIQFLIIPDSLTKALCQIPAQTSNSEAGETWIVNGI